MKKLKKLERFKEKVLSSYDVYNNIFLTLPFESINDTGKLLPIFSNYCLEGYNKKYSPQEIVDGFFEKYCKNLTYDDRNTILFRFIQYIERQVVLFDAIEDASFKDVHNLEGLGSLRNLKEICEKSNKLSELINNLKNIEIRPVLTAHPTQFYPGSVLGIITDLSEAINKNDIIQIKKLLSQLGKTPFFKEKKPTPYDEAVSLTWYLENIFYNAISNIQKYIKSNIADYNYENFELVSLGFWPGGDRDGNPYVTNKITIKTALKLRSDIIKNYYKDVSILRRKLTFKNIEEIIIDIENRLYKSINQKKENPSIGLDELRKKLNYVKNEVILKHESLYLDDIQELIDKVNIFGYHFASLDIRQDSSIHNYVFENVITEIFGKKISDNYKNSSDYDKITFLSNKNFDDLKNEFKNTQVIKTLGSIAAMRNIQKSNGEKGCNRYIISHNQSALNILEVFKMFEVIGWKNPSVDIVPLFETIDDLKNSVSVMENVYNDNTYRLHLEKRNKEQTIMLGFSDGTKDGGYLTANWNILKSKEALVKVSSKYGIKLKFFDGRGGPPARGGGNTHQFYSSIAGIIDTKDIQITIQGQTISSNFGTIDSCQYNLEQLISSACKNLEFNSSKNSLSADNRKTMEMLSKLSFNAYNDFKNHPKFLKYLENMSTIKYYSKTNIGSRPSKRKSGTDLFEIKSLRAIPFVGGWSQLKQNVPGFFGLGSSINFFYKNKEFNKVEKLYKEMPFFRTLLSNSMMSLQKSFFGLTYYLKDDDVYSEIWNIIHSEYELTKKMILKLSGFKKLMENEPANKASIDKREKIILPLITIQQSALQKLNKLKTDKNKSKNKIKVCEKLITRTLFGSINASRNSA